MISGYSIHLNKNNQNIQNKRWDALNLGRISVISADFGVFRYVSQNEFNKKKDWGYEPYGTYDLIRDTSETNRTIAIKSMVVAGDRYTLKLIENTVAIKISELEKQLKGISPNDTSKFYIFKHLDLIVNIKNSGNTYCTVDSLAVIDNTIDKNLSGYHKLNYDQFTIDPEQIFRGGFNIELPINSVFQKNFEFIYAIYYKNVDNISFVKKAKIKFERNSFWVYDL